MFRIIWKQAGEQRSCIVADVRTAFDVWWCLTGYGRKDGCAPSDVVVTNLSGDVVPIEEGLANCAAMGSR